MKKVLFLIVSIVILGLVFAGCGEIFNVTLPDGGSNLSRSIGGGDIIYGIQRYSGDVYSVDVATCTKNLEFSMVPPPPEGSAKPNGLAYDEFTRRFYYCDYQPTSTLYFWDGVTETVAGPIYSGGGGVANGDFYSGIYYFIDGVTDDLYGVILNADGTIASGNTVADKLVDIAGDAHGWTFNGDIGIQNGVVYGWGKCVAHSKYEFFTYDLSTGDFNLFTPTYQSSSLQLAFGTDGTLYGHRSADSGDIFVINKANGDVTGPICSPGVLFTDCASGSTIYIEEVPGIEVVKECPPAAFAYVGDILIYNYTVTNTGDGALLNVILDDDQLGLITLTGLSDEDGDSSPDDLAEGASATGTADYVVLEGDIVLLNTATASSTSEIGDSLVEATSDECMVEICYEETAFGGDTAGDGKAWWFYFSGTGTQTIWAGQHYNAGTVTVSECTITIELADGWYLQDDDESVKIQGYADRSVPTKRQPAGKFETYKGDELVVEVECFDNYIIHLDVQHCGEFEDE